MQSITLSAVSSYAVILAMMVAATSAVGSIAVVGIGACPNPGTVSSFDTSRYLGVWYEYERFANFFEKGLICTTATYGDNGDGSISVVNSGIRKILRTTNSVEGRATVPDPAKPAELSVSFGGPDVGSGPNYFVVDTDYNTYAVVFSCNEVGPGNIQFAWILTRSAGVAPSNLVSLKNNLSNAGIDVNKFNLIDQTNCQ